MEAIALSAQLHRARNRYGWLFSEEGEIEVTELQRSKRISPLVRMLALAHQYQALIDSGTQESNWARQGESVRY